MSDTSDAFREAALAYHRLPKPGKLQIAPTKPMETQVDLALAYSPGVAEACLEIKADPLSAIDYTAKGNLVGVVTNGSAALGLGNIGALASKPIMEGKAVLFKKFAGIDVFDIELNESDPVKLAEAIRQLEPTFGAINLEDVKAPDCFIVEELCRQSMDIPVFHDDQHGTAIVVGAAATNALHLAGKKFEDIKLVSTGGGAAGIACLNLLLDLGVKRENVWLCDIAGLIHEGREEEMTPQKAAYAQPGGPRALGDVIAGADMFLGLSGPNILTPGMAAQMASRAIIFALANPHPEIAPDAARAAKPDAIIATGRSDHPNQVNNVLCFPFIFRGALDVGASVINDEMKIACVNAIAELARRSGSAEAASAYRSERLVFGPEYLVPKPFDPRLLPVVAGAVAEAASSSGVAKRPLTDARAYRASLEHSVYRTAFLMRPVFDAASQSRRRLIFAEGEDERVLRATQIVLSEMTETPILIGRRAVVAERCERFGLSFKPGEDVELIDPEDDPRYRRYWEAYLALMERRGATPDIARAILRTNTTAIGAIAVHLGDADSLICGTLGQHLWHLRYVSETLAHEGGLHPVGALSLMIHTSGPLFIADTQVHPDPTAEEVADIAIAAARHVRRFGLEPQLALVSHSNFGNIDTPSARKMRAATRLLDARGVDFAYEGEMQADAALDPEYRARIFRSSRLSGPANTLIFAGADAASTARNMLKNVAGALEVGPILMGMGNRAHIVTPAVTARGLVNIAALAGTSVRHYG